MNDTKSKVQSPKAKVKKLVFNPGLWALDFGLVLL